LSAGSNGSVPKTDVSATPTPLRIVGYARVSTAEQFQSGAGLDAQHAAIHSEAARRGWHVVRVLQDVASGRSVAGRDGLAQALEMVEGGDADALVVPKLDRLSRSLMDFAVLMERSRKKRWALVALDLGVDTTTPAGSMVASVMATFAEFERRLIGERTREALAVRRSQGVRLGRPPALCPDVRARLAEARRNGKTFRQIAHELNAAQVPTAHGGARWHPATVAKAIKAGGS
jgi:DNA invertase Pin-like site-specific DNA recombinase